MGVGRSPALGGTVPNITILFNIIMLYCFGSNAVRQENYWREMDPWAPPLIPTPMISVTLEGMFRLEPATDDFHRIN